MDINELTTNIKLKKKVSFKEDELKDENKKPEPVIQEPINQEQIKEMNKIEVINDVKPEENIKNDFMTIIYNNLQTLIFAIIAIIFYIIFYFWDKSNYKKIDFNSVNIN